MNRRLLIGIFFSLVLSFMPCKSYACKTKPTAKITDPDDPHYVCLGDSISFDGEDSYDYDNGEPYGGGNGITGYSWDFGDGSSGDEGTDTHSYSEADEYEVELTVTDDDDPSQTDSDSVTIYVMKVEIYIPAPSAFPKYIGIDSSLTLQAKVTPSSATGGTFSWSKVSGPGAVTFTPSGGSTTSFSSSTVGSYTVMVQYTKGGVTCDSDSSGTIEVCDAKMIFEAGEPPAETDSLTRAESGTFKVINGDGDPISGATYSSWAFDGEVIVSDPSHTSSTWSGTIVQSGEASCNVTFGDTTCEVNKSITVIDRSEWSIIPDCDQDNIDGWVLPEDPHGGFPGIVTLGRCRNNHDQSTAVFWPQGYNFEDAYTTAEVSSGPNKNVWYLASSSLVIEWETVINKYAKAGTTPPNPPETNFYEFNYSKGVDAADFLQSIKNHEYKGTGSNGEGHFAYLEEEESNSGNDAKAEIEDNVSWSEYNLKSSTGGDILEIELNISSANHEPPDGSNWSGNIHRYNFDSSVWIETYQKL